MNPIKIIIVLVLLIAAGLSAYIFSKFKISREIELLPETAQPQKDSTISVAFIGDSWVEHGNLDTIVQNQLSAVGIPTEVMAFGQSGAKTKQVYRNLFNSPAYTFSSRKVLEKRPEYCCVITGVNDAVGQVGPKFYSQHLLLIIKTLVKQGIRPVVVSLPEFDIVTETARLGNFNRWKNTLLARFTNNGEIDNIHNYRKYFEEELIDHGLRDKIIYVDFDEICADHNKCRHLYANPAHLSPEGNQVLGKKIAQVVIAEVLRTRNQ